MKIPPQPATVCELDQYGDPVLRSKVSATRDRITKRNPTPYSLNGAQHRPRKSQNCIRGESTRSGSLNEMVRAYGQDPKSPMTIFSSSQDTDSERNNVPGCFFRKVSFLDETKVLDSSAIDDGQRCIRLTAFIAKNDEDHIDPKIYVEQRVYEGMSDNIIVHELAFGGRIQLDKEYVFPACGDEDRILGKRDLTLRMVSFGQESFNSYLRGHTTYHGYDIKDYIYVDEESISKESPHTAWRSMSQAPYKVSLNAKDLQILRKAKQENRETAEVLSGEDIELFQLRFVGQGHPIEDNMSAGDLVVCVIFRP
ncbi:hypothetical protein N7471_009755 [Penicillium samsonianum]|uniref:uncharacterized protein n=1 Tax=Penicillium samsonianum TaxID=1882272 RepID=UPI002548F4E8|nr:uncharacterized protein N7471_009755 [Penicillium samsonianum]KAJ6128538.1 hypothetical protein N7471_009755 [Penicillium samsonianum]